MEPHGVNGNSTLITFYSTLMYTWRQSNEVFILPTTLHYILHTTYFPSP